MVIKITVYSVNELCFGYAQQPPNGRNRSTANTNSTFGRTLQANYVDGLSALLDNDKVSNDVKAAARATLTSLRSGVNTAGKGIVGGHQMELAHKIDVALQGIESIMKGK